MRWATALSIFDRLYRQPRRRCGSGASRRRRPRAHGRDARAASRRVRRVRPAHRRGGGGGGGLGGGGGGGGSWGDGGGGGGAGALAAGGRGWGRGALRGGGP